MKKTLIPILALAAISSSQAATLVSYDFNDLAAPLANSVVAIGVSAGDLTIGAGLISAIQTNANAFVDGNGVASSLGGNTAGFGLTDMNNVSNLTLAITNNDFVGLTLSVDPGESVDFTSLSFQFRTNSLNNGAETYSVFSSIDGFAEANALVTTSLTNAGVYELQTIDLTSFSGISSDTEFRVYIYGANGANNGATNIDELTLSGSIPEPTSTALLGLGAFVLILRRKK